MYRIVSGFTDTLIQVKNLLHSSEKYCCLISPYWDLPGHFVNSILSASDRGVKVLLFRKNMNFWSRSDFFDDAHFAEMNQRMSKLDGHENISIRSNRHIHMKCYFNESSCLISSMNLCHTSKDNLELGILFDWCDDVDFSTSVLREIQNRLLYLLDDDYSVFSRVFSNYLNNNLSCQ